MTTPVSGDFAELGPLALRFALTDTVGQQGPSLFGSSLEDLQGALCIDRRFATIAAGKAGYDPAERYRVDIYRQGLSSGNDQTLALSYVRFATEVEDLDETGLFLRFGELHECIDPIDPDAQIVATTLVNLIKRHASAVVRVIEEQIALAKSELARGRLPPHCLLRLLASSG